MEVFYKMLMGMGSLALAWLVIMIWNSTSGWITGISLAALLVFAFGVAAARDYRREYGPTH